MWCVACSAAGHAGFEKAVLERKTACSFACCTPCNLARKHKVVVKNPPGIVRVQCIDSLFQASSGINIAQNSHHRLLHNALSNYDWYVIDACARRQQHQAKDGPQGTPLFAATLLRRPAPAAGILAKSQKLLKRYRSAHCNSKCRWTNLRQTGTAADIRRRNLETQAYHECKATQNKLYLQLFLFVENM